MSSVAANGITIEYEIHGHGEPLLLVHGLGAQLSDWHPDFIAEFVDRGFQVITFDNRDMGLSTEFDWKPPSPVRAVLGALFRRPARAGYLLTDMADDASGLLDALGIASAHVVGVSMGGMISQTLAIRHPEKVRSLTSIMSNTGDKRHGAIAPSLMVKMARRRKPTLANAVEQAITTVRWISGPAFNEAVTRPLIEHSVARSFRPAGIARQTAAILASPNRTEALGKVTVPTLVIHGSVDPLVLPSGGVATAKAIPGSRLLVFPDMGHDIPRNRWAEVLDAIRQNAQRSMAER